jgi:hypothetical protein
MFQSLYNYLYQQDPTGGIPLKGTGLVVGALLLLTHLYAWLRSEQVKGYLPRFPRDYFPGAVLLTVAMLWSMVCLACMDMGEFYHLRGKLLFAVPVSYVLVLVYVREFLAVRALGCVLLLAAGPVLQAAFLQPQQTRLLLPLLAYVWIIAGMFMIGTPYMLRDWIQWVLKSELRWKLATLSGVAYGTLLISFALLFW